VRTLENAWASLGGMPTIAAMSAPATNARLPPPVRMMQRSVLCRENVSAKKNVSAETLLPRIKALGKFPIRPGILAAFYAKCRMWNVECRM
jgi:hypothetical protein